jgi:hypothetical protein
MRGYLSLAGRSVEIPVESTTEVYRDPDDSQEILVETGDDVRSLGISDPTVSRKKDESAPVQFVPQSEAIEIQNRGNSNGVTLDPNGKDVEIGDGYSRRVQHATAVQIGYHTTLELTVEREARYDIRGVEGDVVTGQQTKVDDSVVGPDANVGGGSTEVTDSVVGPRADVGGNSEDGTKQESTDTQGYCQTHQISYTGDHCPKCTGTEPSKSAERTGARQADTERASHTDSGETKFCIYCGESIPAVASVCPDCGKHQPET